LLLTAVALKTFRNQRSDSSRIEPHADRMKSEKEQRLYSHSADLAKYSIGGHVKKNTILKKIC